MIYLDNAATTFQKPKAVRRAMNRYMKHDGGNPGRGGHFMAMRAANTLFQCRVAIAKLISAMPEQIALLPSATIGLNTVIKGVLRASDHVLITHYEHNSVLRPVHQTCAYSVCSSPQDAENKICDQTKLLVVNHASNVNGKIQDLQGYIALCRRENLRLLVDASQTVGHLPLTTDGIDFLVASGHKGLFGPQGTGFLYMRRGLTLPSLYEGGTGFLSESPRQPELFPDALESGTANGVGFAGLAAGVRFVCALRHEETDRLNILLKNGLAAIPRVTVYSPLAEKTVPVVAFNVKNADCVTVADYLSERYNICVRAGLHCAPLAHKTLGTLGVGAVRVSLSHFNCKKDVEKFLNIIDSTHSFGV